MIRINNPIHARIIGHDDKLAVIKSFLTYTDKSVEFAIRKLKRAHWFDPEKHAEALEDLQVQKRPCLLMEDENGYYTYSGLAQDLSQLLRTTIESEIKYPKPKIIPWAVVPPELRPYQIAAKDALLTPSDELLLKSEGMPRSVEIGTGLGKSYIIMNIVKELGLKTVVMCPSTSIADQLLADFTKFMGKKYVGQFYGGKKDSKKLVTIAIHASLARIVTGGEHWDNFFKASVFIADESHLTPAKTLSEVCTGLFPNAPYRFFFSGTQVRGDGADLLLRGIIGPIVYKMTVADGVTQNWLAKPNFKMLRIVSNSSYSSEDANKMTREHLFYNPLVNQKAAQIANAAVANGEGPVLILVDEIKQFAALEPLLRHKCAFAYGTLTDDNIDFVQPKYRQNDNTEIVKEFNAGNIPILIGTSAVSMGTDIRAVKTGIYIRGGKSPIDVPQSVGRCTRLVPGKTEFTWIDFDITNIETLHRHSLERLELYHGIYPDVEVF